MEIDCFVPRYSQQFLANNLPAEARAGSRISGYWAIRNESDFVWENEEATGRLVALAVYLNDVHASTALPIVASTAPGDCASFSSTFALPDYVGPITIRVTLVHHNHAYFPSSSCDILTLTANPYAAEEAEIARTLAANYSYFLPTGGMVARNDGGRWPVFAKEAKGARVQTDCGGEFIDYLMGWGSALLGHGHPAVAAAVQKEISGGVTMSLPHIGEVETGRVVLAAFPHHQMVQFGKNGSDVCTLAVRMMRVHSGRRKVLFWGYHGWQDWFAARLGFAGTGVMEGPENLYGFVYGDRPALDAYLEQNASEVAGIIMEPGAAVLGPEGPIPEVDTEFLQHVRAVCDRYQLILAFDEIYTGFRHPQGSAEAATGVHPDITLLGKGLAAGYPLGALLTQRWLFESTAGRVMYGPTYKGERIALAACRATLIAIQEFDLPEQLNQFGLALRPAVLDLPGATELGLRWIGPPYRQMVILGAGTPLMRTWRRILLLQELLRRGVLSYKGLFLPSAAHGNEELLATVEAFRGALQIILQAGEGPSVVRFLEIPPPS